MHGIFEVDHIGYTLQQHFVNLKEPCAAQNRGQAVTAEVLHSQLVALA